jgi:Skp family chaperone for outer membrane proteins
MRRDHSQWRERHNALIAEHERETGRSGAFIQEFAALKGRFENESNDLKAEIEKCEATMRELTGVTKADEEREAKAIEAWKKSSLLTIW